MVPSLPTFILNELIHPLKALTDELSNEEEKDISMEPFLKILTKVEKKDHLLADFLNVSGYVWWERDDPTPYNLFKLTVIYYLI